MSPTSNRRRPDTLIVGSAVYGLGETVQLSFNVALGELVPNKYRPAILSFIFLTNAPIATFGSVIARKFIEHPSLGWRFCYYINIIVVGLAIILLFLFYRPPKFEQLHEHKTKRQLLKELDYVGIFLWTAGLTVFLMGISWGGVIYPWKSAAVISSTVLGGVCLIVLFIYEGFDDLKYPAIPVKFFANRGFISLDVTYAGWLSSTVASATALGQICAAVIVKWGENTRYWLIFSACSMVGFVAALAAFTPSTLKMGIAFTMIGPFFVGFIELASLALAPLFCKAADIGLASGLLASIRSAGGLIAVAVYVTILNNRLATPYQQILVPLQRLLDCLLTKCRLSLLPWLTENSQHYQASHQASELQ
ncbi:TRI12-domain-containing protein [Rhizodiscina lignyota]|uniref:TRI12-domain-containing protein n=1 Tax=Rhizodiscina lignyota TaxID=1504668 RepID=A0A9P4IRV4_9PEZI|nr:TRI12-domain-containing protein [Rhizodiscina lignyota]